MRLRIGVDLGGSNLRCALFVDDTTVASELIRESLPMQREPETIVAVIAAHCRALIAHIEPSVGPIAVGVGIAAMLSDRQGTVANAPNLGWRDVAFGPMLAEALGATFVVGIYNDVNAIAWGESTFGAGRGYADVLAVFVGTGIGAGVIANHVLVEGHRNCAGELGHCKIAWGADAQPCACGSRGCVEAYAGGASLLRRIRRDLRDGHSLATVVHAGSIDAANPSHVEAAAADGDRWALEFWQQVATELAVAIGNALAVLNSECLVLGGGVLEHAPILIAHILTAMEIVAPQAALGGLTVVSTELGDTAGLLGASDLAQRSIG
jgi:glucokinase